MPEVNPFEGFETKEPAHAILGASSSKRWLSCPGSIRLIASLPESDAIGKSSIYAAEGTGAHELAEICLRGNKNAHDMLGMAVGRSDDYPDGFEVTHEMANAVQVYLDVVRETLEAAGPGAEMNVEQRFNLDWLHPGMFGTNDCVVAIPFGRLTVFDYKHGAGVPVDVKDNTQLLYYALGAAHGEDFADFELVIVQPRAPHSDGPVRRWVVSADDMEQFRTVLKQGAETTEQPDAPLATGDHCRWCDAAAICPAMEKRVLDTAVRDFGGDLVEPKDLSPDQLGRVLAEAELVHAYVENCKAFATQQLMHGHPVTGFKLVRGRSNRKWENPEEAGPKLARWLGAENVYKPKEMQGITAIENAVKSRYPAKTKDEKEKRKEVMEKVNGFTIKPEGKLTLVGASDPREEVQPDAITDFDAVTGNENEGE